MARRRMIEVSISHDMRFNRLTEWAQLIFFHILPHTDDVGRFDGNPETVRVRTFPYSPRSVDEFADAIAEMIEWGVLDAYATESGEVVLQCKAESFRRINAVLVKNSKGHSEYDEPASDDLLTAATYRTLVSPFLSRDHHVAGTCQTRDIVSRKQEVEGSTDGSGSTEVESLPPKEPEPASPPLPKKRPRAEAIPANLDVVRELFHKRDYHDPDNEAEKFYNHFQANGWVIGKARAPCRDWKAAAATWNSNAKQYSSERERTNATQRTTNAANNRPVNAVPSGTLLDTRNVSR